MGYVEASDTPNQAVAACPRLDAVGAGGEKVELAIDAVQCEVHKASEVTQGSLLEASGSSSSAKVLP